MCAERVAIGAALSEGAKEFDLLVVVADSEKPVVPCGACRQVLAEFNPELRIISATPCGRAARNFGWINFCRVPSQGILG